MNEISKSTLKETKRITTAIYGSLFDPADKFNELEGLYDVTDYGIFPFNEIKKARKIELTYNEERFILYLYNYIYNDTKYLVIKDEKKEKNLLQINLDECIKPSEGTFFLIHDGNIPEKSEEYKNLLLDYIENTAPHLITIVDDEKNIELGNLEKEFEFNSEEFQKFIASFIEYAILCNKFENGDTNIINVKDEFVDWMVANVSEGNYFKNQFDSNRVQFEKEINEYEVIYKENFDSELFILNPIEYKNEIDLRRSNIYKPSTSFAEYSSNRASGRPKAILGKNNYLRFLEERFTPKSTINYWVFQGSPKIYDMVGALEANVIKTWTVSAHKDKIKVGDKFILWQTGTNSGCYALGRVTSPVTYMKEEDPEMDFYLKTTDQIENNRVSIEIEHNYSNSPILWETIKDDEVFKDFKGGNQGTNFSATKEQYETLLDLTSSNTDGAYEAVKKVLDPEKLKSFLTILRAFVKSNAIKPNDERISFNVWKKSNNLVFLIGRRYVLNIQKKGDKTEFTFTTKTILTEINGGFTNQKGEIEAYWNIADNIENYISEIEEGLSIELGRNAKCPYRKYTNQDFIDDIFPKHKNPIKFIVANITWNSKDWKEVSEDASGHAWVGGENIPHESWNFDFDNPRNTNGTVLGFAKFTNAPKVKGDKNLILFYSQGKIVGFYGRAEILRNWVVLSDKESYNLIGDKNLSVVLKNKIDHIKEKGYLENKERVGQVGFSYLEKTETALNVLDEALQLNPEQHQVLTNIKEWILENTNPEINSNNNSMESFDNTIALNQILYGPPGTGKTYNTVLEAAKIVTGNAAISYDEALKVFNDNLNNQIEFITFHQNYSYEDFIQGLRPDTENGDALTFEKKDGVFKRIADKALKNLVASENPASAKKDFDIVFQELIQPLNDGDVEEIEIKMKKSSFFITAVGEKSIEFRKSIGDSEHTLSITTLRKMYDRGVNDLVLGGLQQYYNPFLELLSEKGKSQVVAVDRKNYVIIIDEINRANISRVFGELITLIEDDKRSHGKIPMRVTLPSGDPFIVPSNLYLIGTMNTADKSIALLDIALRRRFEFIPKYPDETLVNAEFRDVFTAINKTILERKNHDFTIGHAYFMGDGCTLEKTINNKVIPLLMEYFMNDEKEVTAILQAAKIPIGGWPLKMIV